MQRKNKKNTNEFSLDEIIGSTKWKIISHSSREGIKPDQIRIAFSSIESRDSNCIDQVTIRFGNNILKKMKWNIGDKVCVMNDPNYLLRFLFVKSENGRKLTLEKSSQGGIIGFKWPHTKECPLEKMRSTAIKYDCNKDYIVLCVDNDNFIF